LQFNAAKISPEATVTSFANRTNIGLSPTHVSLSLRNVAVDMEQFTDYGDFRSLTSFKSRPTILLVNFNEFLMVYKYSSNPSNDYDMLYISPVFVFSFFLLLLFCM